MSEKEMLVVPDKENEYPSNSPPIYTEKPGVIFMQQQQPTSFLVSGQPPDYLYLSLFSIIFCCWPFGLVALLRSIETRRHIQEGRAGMAYGTSADARRYNKIAIIVGIIFHIVGWILIVGSTVVRVTFEANTEDN